MRIKRQKGFRRSLRFFRLAFDIQSPYKVLVDGTFLTNALQNKIHIREQVPKILNGGKMTPMVTNCVLDELRSLGDRGRGAVHIAQGYYRVKCNHACSAGIGAARCIKEQIGTCNDRRLMVATQDQELAKELRNVPGVPLLRLHGPVPYLEDPSAASQSTMRESEAKSIKAASWEKDKLFNLAQKEALATLSAEKPKKRKGPKGANPLSCKKKKKTAPDEGDAAAAPAAEAAEAAEVPKAKRTRSRRMGTVSRAEAEARAAAAGTASAEPPRSRRRGRGAAATAPAAAAAEPPPQEEEDAGEAAGLSRRPRHQERGAAAPEPMQEAAPKRKRQRTK